MGREADLFKIASSAEIYLLPIKCSIKFNKLRDDKFRGKS